MKTDWIRKKKKLISKHFKYTSYYLTVLLAGIIILMDYILLK